jgi:predicted PurR-regulated permease PerM
MSSPDYKLEPAKEGTFSRGLVRSTLQIIIILLSVVAGLWVLYQLTPIVLLLVLSIFFAYLLAPLVDLVQRPVRIGGKERSMPRALAIAVVYIALFFAVAVVIYFVVPQLAAQFPEFKQQATSYYKTLSNDAERLNQYFKQHRMPGTAVDTINSEILNVVGKAGAMVAAAVEGMLPWMAFHLPWLVLVPILAFFLLKDADGFRRSALQMFPRGRWRWRADEFFQDVNSTLAAYIRAQLTACLVVGGLSSLGFALMGLPSPLVLGVIAGALEFIPLVGPLIMALLATLLALLYSGPGMALAVLLFLGVLRIAQDYFIYPRIIGKGIHLHPLAVILAILCGAELAGVAGIFLAIPVIAIVTVSYRHWLEHRGSESIAEVLEEAAADHQTIRIEIDAANAPRHPTTSTSADEMARVRPDLMTGELKMPKLE